MDQHDVTRTTRGVRRPTGLRAVCALALLTISLAGCGSDDEAEVPATAPAPADPSTPAPADPSTPAPAGSTPAAADEVTVPAAPGAGALDVDPCSLLTVPELEAAIGSGVEQGGFGEDQPGRCTWSIGGDVGAGVVSVAISDPMVCTAIRAALDTDSLDPSLQQRVDLADGAVAAVAGGSLDVLVGDGCLGVHGSDGGEPLTVDVLTSLATAAIGRLT